MTLFHKDFIEPLSNGVLRCTNVIHNSMDDTAYRCGGIEEVIQADLDAPWIQPGYTVVLEVFAYEANSVTSVKIEDKPIAGEVYHMRGMHTRDSGGTTSLDLGVWMPGEGRRSIRAAILQTIAGCIDPRDVGSKNHEIIYTKCPNPAHGLREDRLMRAKSQDTRTTYKSLCLFNIVMEKMCSECLWGIKTAADENFGIPEDIDA